MWILREKGFYVLWVVSDTMPISTDSEVWETGDETPRFHKKVLAFLRDHPSQAYRRRELADTLLGTSFHV